MARKEAAASSIVDWRSTGRRKARRVLYRSRVSYECIDCGVTSAEPPKDAPKYFADLWPIEEKTAEGKVISSQLQADHETKDLEDNSEDTVNWRCPSCHKLRDQQTDRGESTQEQVNWF